MESEKLIMKTFRLEPSIWDILDEHKRTLGARDRTAALRIIIKNANVQSAQIVVDARENAQQN